MNGIEKSHMTEDVISDGIHGHRQTFTMYPWIRYKGKVLMNKRSCIRLQNAHWLYLSQRHRAYIILGPFHALQHKLSVHLAQPIRLFIYILIGHINWTYLNLKPNKF